MKVVVNKNIHDVHIREFVYQNKQLLTAIFVSLLVIIGTILKLGLKNINRYVPVTPVQVSRSERRLAAEAESSKNHRRKAVVGETYNPEADKNGEIVKHHKTDAQRQNLQTNLKKILLLQNLYSEQFDQILDAFFLKTVKSGEYVIKEGDEGDYFYVIEKGTYSIIKEENGLPKVIQKYIDAGSFGELALLYSIPRSASVKAETEGLLWALDSKTFRRIIIKAAHKNRKAYLDMIKNVKILSHLTEKERMSLADNLVQKVYKDGEVILKEGDEANGMYFVIDGHVSISKNVNGKKVNMKSVEKGGYFGELALLTNAQRAATAVAKGKLTTAFLDAQAFSRLMGPCEDAMRANMEKYGIKKENIV
ncbi:cAMP-dependent protein kinase type II regulatory subunit-like isoform X2 [Cimex lectularius]|uniref:Cyclic nucleotide-binding domain-containing protein n=1 Tax=Cimex lectularius TaxID=79782 RepID=A0A8I6TCH4_CIMLE|nr:cAMP-dependent protein kinase type II regulatory subunit-like isoform X2 [Cimex lectularius]